MLIDDGTCNYTCANYGDFGRQDKLTQCMIYDNNPWAWNFASAGVINVDASNVFYLQGPSYIGEYEGRVEVIGGDLVMRHVLLKDQVGGRGGGVTITGGNVTMESCEFDGNRYGLTKRCFERNESMDIMCLFVNDSNE